MEFVKQPVKLTVPQMEWAGNPEKREKHGMLFPNSIRGIICGPSNSGKTNLMISLLTQDNGLRFANCYVFSKSLHQPKYTFLRKVLDGVKEVGCYFYNDHETVIPPSQVRPNSIMIFDDVATERQDVIRDYFCMGRHNHVDVFYLSQTYSRIPKHLIRDNANIICLFKQDETNLKHVYDDKVNTDMTFDTFKTMCGKCWEKNKYGYLVIDTESSLSNGRYRRGFDEFIKLWKGE